MRSGSAWRDELGDRADVRIRAEVVDLLGPVDDWYADRIGDVVAIARDDWALTSDRVDRIVSGLRGQHGGLTDEEVLIPLRAAGAAVGLDPAEGAGAGLLARAGPEQDVVEARHAGLARGPVRRGCRCLEERDVLSVGRGPGVSRLRSSRRRRRSSLPRRTHPRILDLCGFDIVGFVERVLDLLGRRLLELVVAPQLGLASTSARS